MSAQEQGRSSARRISCYGITRFQYGVAILDLMFLLDSVAECVDSFGRVYQVQSGSAFLAGIRGMSTGFHRIAVCYALRASSQTG